MFLVDTDALSATAPTKASPDNLRRWFQSRADDLYVSTITIAELRRGIAVIAAKGQTRKADLLRQWEASLTQAFADRIIPVDMTVALRAGDLLGAAETRGFHPGIPDACIAATASLHNLTVLTGNARHFGALGVAFRLVPDDLEQA